MNQSLINQYKISFTNNVIEFVDSGKEISKIPNTNSIYLSNFLDDFNAQEIDELLLSDINDALLNPNSEIENGSETISIIIYQNRVDFYDDDGFVYEIPTIDFKEIVIGWRDFLLTPPLNGTKVQ
jgi:hypothetical protein